MTVRRGKLKERNKGLRNRVNGNVPLQEEAEDKMDEEIQKKSKEKLMSEEGSTWCTVTKMSTDNL